MSHFSTIRTKLADEEILKKAIKEMGFTIKVGKDLPLYNILGEKTSKADIVISGKEGTTGNDIGLRKNGQHYDVIYEHDSAANKAKDFVNKLVQRYAYHKVRQELSNAGFSVLKEEKLRDGTIEIVAAS